MTQVFCAHCGDEIRKDADGVWIDSETHTTCDEGQHSGLPHGPAPEPAKEQEHWCEGRHAWRSWSKAGCPVCQEVPAQQIAQIAPQAISEKSRPTPEPPARQSSKLTHASISEVIAEPPAPTSGEEIVSEWQRQMRWEGDALEGPDKDALAALIDSALSAARWEGAITERALVIAGQTIEAMRLELEAARQREERLRTTSRVANQIRENYSALESENAKLSDELKAERELLVTESELTSGLVREKAALAGDLKAARSSLASAQEQVERLREALRYIRDLSHQRIGKEPRDKTLDVINKTADAALASEPQKESR